MYENAEVTKKGSQEANDDVVDADYEVVDERIKTENI